MKDKPFRLVRVEWLDGQTDEPLYQRPMWLGAWGARRTELSPEEIYWAYHNRFDIEHFFRFGKQRLLLNAFQTPDETHWQNWLEVISLAYWLLWVASDEASHQVKKWQQYDQNVKNREKTGLRPSPSAVQQQMQAIILAFEQDPFLPKLQIKGKGRVPGTRLPKRTRYPVRKSNKTKKNRDP